MWRLIESAAKFFGRRQPGRDSSFPILGKHLTHASGIGSRTVLVDSQGGPAVCCHCPFTFLKTKLWTLLCVMKPFPVGALLALMIALVRPACSTSRRKVCHTSRTSL